MRSECGSAQTMPTSEAESNVTEPREPVEAGQEEVVSAEDNQPRVRGSRWVDYDTHELLEMISELEDERRWSRLREGIWIALLVHFLLLSALTWIPKYILKEPQVIDPFDAIKQRKDLTYLDLPPDALRQIQPKVKVQPKPEKLPPIDKKTLEEMSKPTPPAPEQAPPPPEQTPAKPQPTQPLPTVKQSPVQAPSPAAVPARPNFAMLEHNNPADQMRDAMRAASRNPGAGNYGQGSDAGLRMHPGAGTGGVQVLSDTQGVDFNSWLQRWHWETERTWDPLIPDEVNPPISKSGMVAIRFKVLPNGRVMDGSMVLEGRSGDVALDRAAWGAIIGSNYPPLPRAFHGPYLELRAYFLYNMQPPQ